MTRIIALILMASPVAAETVPLNPDGTAWVSVEPVSGPQIADVTFMNRLTSCTGWCQADFVIVLPIADAQLTVLLRYESGLIPDVMTVIPPDGFVAIPDHVAVGEDRRGVISIFEAGLS